MYVSFCVLMVKLNDFKKEVHGVWDMKWCLEYCSTGIFVVDADEQQVIQTV